MGSPVDLFVWQFGHGFGHFVVDGDLQNNDQAGWDVCGKADCQGVVELQEEEWQEDGEKEIQGKHNDILHSKFEVKGSHFVSSSEENWKSGKKIHHSPQRQSNQINEPHIVVLVFVEEEVRKSWLNSFQRVIVLKISRGQRVNVVANDVRSAPNSSTGENKGGSNSEEVVIDIAVEEGKMRESVTSSNSSNSFQASVNHSGINVSNDEGRVLESNDGGDLNEHKVSVNVCSLVILFGLLKVLANTLLDNVVETSLFPLVLFLEQLLSFDIGVYFKIFHTIFLHQFLWRAILEVVGFEQFRAVNSLTNFQRFLTSRMVGQEGREIVGLSVDVPKALSQIYVRCSNHF